MTTTTLISNETSNSAGTNQDKNQEKKEEKSNETASNSAEIDNLTRLVRMFFCSMSLSLITICTYNAC